MPASVAPLLATLLLQSAQPESAAHVRIADAEPPRAAAAAPAVPAADPEEVRRAARSAQSRVEYFRRRPLPIGYRGSGGRCDAHFGRFCYWYEDEEPRRPPEPEVIARERARFVALLDSLASLAPADGWIVGEHIRYLLEDDRVGEAVGVARSCRAERGWCAALAGLAFHAAGRFGGADSAFSVALAALPEKERCEWTDLSDLLDGELRKRYRKLRCGEREAMQRRLWWLGKPLQMIPGNDLRTEHYARQVMARLQDRTMTPHGRWSRAQADMMLRYGWARWWTQSPRDPMTNSEPSVSGHEHWPSYHHFPTAGAVADPARAAEADWRLDRAGVPSRYSPRHAAPLRRLEHQLSVFERGDSLLVAVAYDARRDAWLWTGELVAGLVLSDGTGADEPVIARLDGAPSHGALTLTAPRTARLVSVEFMNPARGAAARARYGLGAPPSPGGVRMSRLLLVDAEEGPLPRSLDEALPRALSTTRLYEPRIGVVWEVYGLDDPASEANVAVRVERLPGLGERMASRLRLRDPQAPVQLRFPQTFAGADGVALGALTLDLSSFEPGTYRLEVTVTLPGMAPMVETREIEILRLERR